MIQFDHVTRKYGGKIAVSDLTLDIPAGEVFAFLGPNGAGKTTTIKVLVGLLHPTAGMVYVCGQETSVHAREAARFIGYVPDEPFLYDKLSGREFLEFVGRMRGFERGPLARAINRESEQFELVNFLDDLCETYSHGMKQRLVFAAAMLHEPRVLVVDEPMVGLDPRSVRIVKDLLRSRASEGATVFMSTHTLSVAEEVADRIGILDRGGLKFLGTKNDLERKLESTGISLEELFLQMTGGDRPSHTPRHPTAPR